jgi:hypothetical protein
MPDFVSCSDAGEVAFFLFFVTFHLDNYCFQA